MARFALSAFADEAGDSLEEQIAALKENEIDYIEPRNISKRGILDFSEEELVNLKKELDKNNIKVNSLGSPIGKYKITDAFEPHLELTRKAIRACEILGTKNMRMFSFFVKSDEIAKHRDEVIRRLNIMAEEAKACGINMCHENESRIYGQMPAEVADVLTSVPALYGVFDPANYRMNDADVMEGIKATFINFKYMHIKDAIYSEQMIVPAGDGEGKIGEIIDLINDHTDDLVYLTLEPHLHKFSAYADIDDHELKGRYKFSNNREAFDFAVTTLKNLLIKHGYRKDENNEWIK